ncbi:hypothetical protein BH09DEP1_BH09DEP1_2900 [soil metagenome]
MKAHFFIFVILISTLITSTPGKIIFANGKVIEVPDSIIIKSENTNARVFVKEKSVSRSALTPEQEVARARILAIHPKAVLSNEKVTGEILEPGESKELAVNIAKDAQPIKVIPIGSDGSEFTVKYPTYWQQELEPYTPDRSSTTVFVYHVSDIINQTVDEHGFTKRIEKK